MVENAGGQQTPRPDHTHYTLGDLETCGRTPARQYTVGELGTNVLSLAYFDEAHFPEDPPSICIPCLRMAVGEKACPHGTFPEDKRERPYLVWPSELKKQEVCDHRSSPASQGSSEYWERLSVNSEFFVNNRSALSTPPPVFADTASQNLHGATTSVHVPDDAFAQGSESAEEGRSSHHVPRRPSVHTSSSLLSQTPRSPTCGSVSYMSDPAANSPTQSAAAGASQSVPRSMTRSTSRGPDTPSWVAAASSPSPTSPHASASASATSFAAFATPATRVAPAAPAAPVAPVASAASAGSAPVDVGYYREHFDADDSSYPGP